MTWFLLLCFIIPTALAGDTCTNGITCLRIPIIKNTLTFSCRIAGPPSSNGTNTNILFLHGFPEWSSMFAPLLRQLAHVGYRGVACNLRGYSAGASPPLPSDYTYDKLVTDVFNIADAVNFTSFHLVGHDHGGLLAWAAAAAHPERLLTVSALSTPHADAFASALFGPLSDMYQISASQYFTMFTLNNSASLHDNFFFSSMGSSSSDEDMGESFTSAQAFQKALWWYNGAIDFPSGGVMATPPIMSVWNLTTRGDIAMASLRALFGGTPDTGRAALKTIGNISVPALFVCGASDDVILCNRP